MSPASLRPILFILFAIGVFEQAQCARGDAPAPCRPNSHTHSEVCLSVHRWQTQSNCYSGVFWPIPSCQMKSEHLCHKIQDFGCAGCEWAAADGGRAEVLCASLIEETMDLMGHRDLMGFSTSRVLPLRGVCSQHLVSPKCGG